MSDTATLRRPAVGDLVEITFRSKHQTSRGLARVMSVTEDAERGDYIGWMSLRGQYEIGTGGSAHIGPVEGYGIFARQVTTRKTTLELQHGDRVRLPLGAERTVDRIEESGYLNHRDEIIFNVLYVQGADGDTGRWSSGNSATSATDWEVLV